MRRISAALVLAAASCLRQNPEFDGSSAGHGSTSAETGTGVATSTGSTGTTGATSAGSGGGSSTGTTGTEGSGGSSGPGGTTGMEVYTVSSCAELKQHLISIGQMAASGFFWITPSPSPVEVYCDMFTDGGGWTLVGRSAGLDQLTSFGWRSPRGSVEDDAAPYSLDLTLHPVPFTQILLGDRGAGKAWGEHAYRFEVGDTYVDDLVDVLAPLTFGGAVLGDCMPPGIAMFAHGGYTKSDEAFFFRDFEIIDTAYYGLLANGFFLFDLNTTCEQMGLLHKKQGMIMVR